MEQKHPREGVLSASTKIDYIIDVLNRCGYGIDIISKSGVSCPSFVYDAGGVRKMGVNTIRHFASFGCTKSPLRIFSRWLNSLHFFFWLLFHTKRNEQILVYHSLGYCMLLNALRKVKKLRIIGEIEEIYQDVHEQSIFVSRAEYDFINGCDKYLFPTILMNEKFNVKGKPFAIVHGVYKPEEKLEDKFNDGKIHVVYGGTFDPQKGGAMAAAECGRYLPNKYVVHICGFGSDAERSKIKNLINDVNRTSKSKTCFEGLLRGEEYTRFIQKCHVGLSTQNPEAAFNDTSFPSKILVYLANGLDVVSVRIPVVSTCSVVEAIDFYDKQTPDHIASAILHAGSRTIDKFELLKRVDYTFSNDIKKLLSI